MHSHKEKVEMNVKAFAFVYAVFKPSLLPSPLVRFAVVSDGLESCSHSVNVTHYTPEIAIER